MKYNTRLGVHLLYYPVNLMSYKISLISHFDKINVSEVNRLKNTGVFLNSLERGVVDLFCSFSNNTNNFVY